MEVSRSRGKLPPQLSNMQIPMDWMTGPKDKVTLSIPETLNEKVDRLSKELDLTKSLLFLLGVVFVLKLLDDWSKER